MTPNQEDRFEKWAEGRWPEGGRSLGSECYFTAKDAFQAGYDAALAERADDTKIPSIADMLAFGMVDEAFGKPCDECGAVLGGASYDHDPSCSEFPASPGSPQ